MSPDNRPPSDEFRPPLPEEAFKNLPDDPGKTWVPDEREGPLTSDTEDVPSPPAETEAGSQSLSHPSTPEPDAPAEAEEGEPPPRQFGEYELLEKVGTGGMGNVYKARHRGLDRIVALKTLKGGTEQIERQVERFVREAKAAARLDHPNIVTCYEFGEFSGWNYLTMAFVDGESLQDRLTRGPLEPAEAARLVHALAGAVSHAHLHGVIHRDIKPSNVIIGKDGRPRLTDFGIAKLVNPASTPLVVPTQLTQVGQALGTPGYMAPEQSAGRRWEIGPSADIYGLGGLLVAALTGHHPGSHESFETLAQDIPDELQVICDRCLAYRPQDRFAAASQLESALAEYLQGHGPLSLPAAPTPPATTPPPDVSITLPEVTLQFPKRRIYQAGAILVLLLVGTVLLGPRIADAWRVSGKTSEVAPPQQEEGAVPSSSDPTPANSSPPSPTPLQKPAGPIRSRLDVRVDSGDADYLNLDEPNTLPLHPGDAVLADVKADREAVFYLIRIDTRGELHWENQGLPIELSATGAPPPDPAQQAGFWEAYEAKTYLPIDRQGPAGMLTLVLLARSQPLPAEDWASVLKSLPARPQTAPKENAIQWFSFQKGLLSSAGEQGNPRTTRNPLTGDHPVILTLTDLGQKLGEHFESIHALSFAVPERIPAHPEN